MSTGTASSVVSALDGLTAALDATGLQLDLDRSAGARADRTELRDQIIDYLLPRLRRLDAPMLAVLGGSTGSGKSTIANSLVGVEVSRAGVLRPTTRAPVLVCAPADQAWFAGGDILPDLPRVGGVGPGDPPATGAVLQLVATDRLRPGLALIDAPDIDSVEDANRTLATQLLAAADLWLFTTSAVRYADAVPWEFLRQAEARGTSLAVIVNRIPPGAATEIVAHLRQMLADAGLGATPVYPVDQSELIDGRLPPAAIEPVATLLRTLADDAGERAAVVARTLEGALNSLRPRVLAVADAGDEQQVAAENLRLTLEQTYAEARRTLADDISGGTLLRGEVLERWQELIGTAELMRAIQSRISWVRDRLGALVTGRPSHTAEVQGEISSALGQLLVDHADAAALAVATAWRGLPGGRQVLGTGDESRDLERASSAFAAAVDPEIRAWQDDILDLVRSKAAGKRTTARVVALGVNSIGIALMIVLFASTGGITGGEVVIGAGTAGLSQTLLTAIFGEQAVRDLADQARRMLVERVAGLLDTDANRFRTHLWSQVSPPQAVADLRAAVATLEAARAGEEGQR